VAERSSHPPAATDTSRTSGLASAARGRGAARLLGFHAQVSRSFDPPLVELFGELNALYFDSSLPPVPLCRSIPEGLLKHQDLNGLTRLRVYLRGDFPFASLTIYLSDWLFDSPTASEEVRWELVRNTLLHQMAHMAVHLDTLGGVHEFDDHHGPHFADECNRIGDQAGWPRELPSVDAPQDIEDAARWPDYAREVSGTCPEGLPQRPGLSDVLGEHLG